MATWVLNDLFPEEFIDDALLLYEAELDTHEVVVFRQGLAMAREAAERGRYAANPGIDFRVLSLVKQRASRGLCEFCGEKPWRAQRLQIEHMTSKLEMRSLRLPWSIINSPPNLGNVCAACNKRKGSRSLTPEQIRWMWAYHGFGGASEEAHLILFFANVLETHAWDVLPLQAKIAMDMRRPTIRRPTISALLRAKGLPTQEALDRWDRARYEVDRVKDQVWIGEEASDDSREMWGRASWQRCD